VNLLADENFPLLAVEALRDAGHDVLWARADMAGEADDVILQRARSENRVVVTLDEDFGELAFRHGLPATCGIILVRLHNQSPEHIQSRVLETLAERATWAGHLVIVEEHRVRVRPLPGSNAGE
jgi:predicted nuclease of predicted toxin-antitoxin system